jgi:predicted helicase
VQFGFDIPSVLSAHREMIESAHAANPAFREASVKFLDHAREAINPSLSAADVREMLIQHVLTEEIFSKVFGEDDFHRNNNVAKALYALEGTFFTGDLKKRTLKALDPYYAAITGEYEEFPNLCFVDTLDNVHGLRKHEGHMDDLFGSVSEENVGRIRRQNARKISVVIGNPPYNANQQNENENNRNRDYPEIDKRIKETYIKASTAQKTKLYDMYARFFRWASDRVDENGIVAFVNNNSFVDGRTFDGFRKEVAKEFNEIRVVDLKGNARTSGERRRQEGGNVFLDTIRVGVAIWFCVKKKGQKGCRIFYESVRDYAPAEEKVEFLARNPLLERKAEEIVPDVRGNWIHQSASDFDTLVPVASKRAKLAKRLADEKAIFKLFSLGVVTARDEWVYGIKRAEVERKVRFLVDAYNGEVARLKDHLADDDLASRLDTTIKWTRAVKNDLRKGTKYRFDESSLTRGVYRPFVSRDLYFNPKLNEMQYQFKRIFPLLPPEDGGPGSLAILLSGHPESKPFSVLAIRDIPSYDTLEKTLVLTASKLESDGSRTDNITDWALARFRKTYPAGKEKGAKAVTKEAIFFYVYAVLHDPAYREKYALDLRRDFPRVPLHDDFWRWVERGKALADLHVGYEAAEPFPLVRTDVTDARRKRSAVSPRDAC